MRKEELKVESQQVKDRISKYDEIQKEKLVDLGQGPKPYREILMYLNNEIQMSTKMSDFSHRILCFKDDGVYQLHRAIESIYGVSTAKSDSKPSGGESNLEMINIVLADGAVIKVPYGTIDLPEMGQDASITIGYASNRNQLVVKGSCEFRFTSIIDDIIAETKRLLKTDSIYKDQAIELDASCTPKVLDLSSIDNEFMVLPAKTEYELRPLMSRVRKPEECKAKGIPLKTGILMEIGRAHV